MVKIKLNRFELEKEKGNLLKRLKEVEEQELDLAIERMKEPIDPLDSLIVADFKYFKRIFHKALENQQGRI